MNHDAVVERVLAWASTTIRELPWRTTRDPWGVLVSEIMSQQTQVGRVAEKWPIFMDRFPTPVACAESPLGEVLQLWQGMGYPRRARNLHQCAAAIVELGEFPDDLESLLALPGIGPYTARAVLAFAFGHDVGVLDTNVGRVLARVEGRSLSVSEAQILADELVPTGEGWLWNQAMMDLGGTVCTLRTAHCDDCPLADVCVWRGDSDIPDPARRSAGVSRPQAKFEGSERQARGMLLKRLGAGSVSISDVPEIVNRDPVTSQKVLDGLVKDGLCVIYGETIRLP